MYDSIQHAMPYFLAAASFIGVMMICENCKIL
jgi:hypothetical protein